MSLHRENLRGKERRQHPTLALAPASQLSFILDPRVPENSFGGAQGLSGYQSSPSWLLVAP